MRTTKSKTDLVIRLLAQGVSAKSIMIQADCSQALVYKVLKQNEADIARLRNGIPALEKAKAPSIKLPKLDPSQPAAPQMEAAAWKVIGLAAAGEDISVKQINAAREIIRQALRDRVPPPQDRRLTFRIDVIDMQDEQDKPVVVDSKRYDIRPY